VLTLYFILCTSCTAELRLLGHYIRIAFSFTKEITTKDNNVCTYVDLKTVSPQNKTHGPTNLHACSLQVVGTEKYIMCTSFMSRGSSVSIVSGYGLDDRAIEVRSSAQAKEFSCSLCVQTGSGAYPVSSTMGTGGKPWPGREADHSPHLVPMS
jgi:hypothetical protein